MMTYTMPEADLLSDERLVGLTLEGDRDAFGEIVARYQSPICALAYSACGSITRSEDLAQDVFVAAWRRLRELREPSKLKSWLYAIARNLINTAFRQQTRNPLMSAAPLDEALESSSEFCGPSETTISKEEETILWQVLSGLPEVYRQPMVLFYRQEESIASVAEILGISEEAVRQRLSRGRAMLNERVAKVVEIGLSRSGPSKAFGLAVLAALPAASVKAGTVGAAAAAAKGSSVFTGAGLLSIIGSIASSAASPLGGLLGLWGRVQNARSPRERAFVRRTVWGLLAWAVAFLLVYQVLFRLHVVQFSIQPWYAMAWSWFWVVSIAPLVFFSIWRGRGQRQIQIEEGGANANPAWQVWALDPGRPGFRTATYGTQACLVFGCCSWLLVNAMHAKDTVFITLLLALCLLGWLLSSALIVRSHRKTASIRSTVMLCLGLVNLVIANARWDSWFGGDPVLEFSHHLAPWTVNYGIVFFFAAIQLVWWLRHTFMALPDARKAGRIAAGVYLLFLVAGSLFLALVK
jgi:RNA polymerase sigma factor (sigma-70 family)